MLVLLVAAASSAQPYFHRTPLIQKPHPPGSGWLNDVDADGDWAVVGALS